MAHYHVSRLQFWHSVEYTVMVRGAANCAGLDPRIQGSQFVNNVVRAVYTLDPRAALHASLSP